MERYSNLPEYFKLKTDAKADQSQIVKGDKYRFTIITSRLIRMEYQENGIFEDRPTQVVLNRNFDKPKFKVIEEDNLLKIETEDVVLSYNKKKFTTDGLSITIKASETSYSHSAIWRYGVEDRYNLLGTCRTLDQINGEAKLEKGLVSKSGFSIVDDSKSLVFNEDSWVEPRKVESIDIYYLGYGRDYKGCIRDFYELTGNTPLIPRFALGNWWSRYWKYTQDELKGVMEKFKEDNVPLSVCIVDMDWHLVDIDKKYGNGWTGFTWNKELFPNHRNFIKWLHDNNLKTALNLHPADGIRAYEKHYLDVAKEMGVDYKNEETVPFDVANKKFMNVYFDKVIHPMEREGVDFWWLDWQQGDVSSMKGLDPLWMINHLHYNDLKRTGKRGFTFSRYPGLGGHRYPIGFSGDSVSTWKSLKFQPYFTANASNVGYGWWSHDIGGHMLGKYDEELYLRWVQFGVFSPIMRLHSTKSEFIFREPWKYPHDIKESAEEFLRLRHKLIPYIYTMAYRNTKESIPLMLPLYYENPLDEKTYNYKNEYYFGNELIVSPITQKTSNVTRKAFNETYLPEGNWFNLFNGEKFKGNNVYPIYADYNEYPVFAKEGAIVPLAKYSKSNEYSNPNEFDVIVFGGKSNSFTLYEDDGETYKYKNGEFTLTKFDLNWRDSGCSFVINNIDGDKNLVPKNRAWNIKFRGFINTNNINVKVDGKDVKFEKCYDSKCNSLIVTLKNIKVESKVEVHIEQNSLLNIHIDKIEKCKKIVMYANVSIDDKVFLDSNTNLFKENVEDSQKIAEILAININEELKKVLIAQLLA